MAETYTISKEALDHSFRLAQNRYSDLSKVINSRLKATARDNPAVNEMSELVMYQCSLFAGITEAVKNFVQNDPFFQAYSEKVNLVSAYAADISARTAIKDLESKVSESYNTQTQKSKQYIPDIAWNKTDYERVKSVLNSLVDCVLDSKDARISNIASFYKDYIISSDSQIQRKIPQNIYDKIKSIKWKIDSYEIDGLSRIVDTTADDVRIEVKEKNQFHTPLQYLHIPHEKRLPKNRIIGDKYLFETVDNMVKCLFLYNRKEKRNPMQEKGLFNSKLLLQGLPGSGKSTVCFYAIDYAEKLREHTNSDLMVTQFNVDSSYKSGDIQKLKSQLQQITKEDRLFIIFQDELTSLVRKSNGNDSNSKEDINLELQKFLEGEYVNKGNYIFLSTTNKYSEIPLAIRGRLTTYAWAGATSSEEKGKLFRYKFDEGIQAGYVSISSNEFFKLGKIAYENQLDGREITKVCRSLRSNNFRWDGLGEIWNNQDDYKKQLETIDRMFSKITSDMVEQEIYRQSNEKKQGLINSDIYKRA